MYHKIGVVLTSFADVFQAFIPRPPTSALRNMKFLSWKPTNHSQLPIFSKVAFDLYDLSANVSINMADIEVGPAGNNRNPSSSWLVDIFSYIDSSQVLELPASWFVDMMKLKIEMPNRIQIRTQLMHWCDK